MVTSGEPPVRETFDRGPTTKMRCRAKRSLQRAAAELVDVLEEREGSELDRLGVRREDVDGVDDVLECEAVLHRCSRPRDLDSEAWSHRAIVVRENRFSPLWSPFEQDLAWVGLVKLTQRANE